MAQQFYSNGKLLLTGEYVVLDGAKALALPTKPGQSLTVQYNDSGKLIWESLDENNNPWFSEAFTLSAVFDDGINTTNSITFRLICILKAAKKLNPEFLTNCNGVKVTTKLTFPRLWGLGTSSTLIHNVSLWANVNPYKLLQETFKGSGYDIACAKHNTPILYSLQNGNPTITPINFKPQFSNQLFFVYLNKKQSSKDAIAHYKTIQSDDKKELIKQISALTNTIATTSSINTFKEAINEHENILASYLKLEKVKDLFFSDYPGSIKSLGAWGGDFVLATGNEFTPMYFAKKGFDVVIPFNELIL